MKFKQNSIDLTTTTKLVKRLIIIQQILIKVTIMSTIPTIQQLAVLATRSPTQQKNIIAAWNDANNLEMLVNLVYDSDMKNKIIAQITLRRKQLSGSNEIKKQSAKVVLKELANLKKWKYVLVVGLFSLFVFIFGGLILGRNTTEVTGNVVPFSNIASFEYLTANNFSSIGNLWAISIKTHTQSLTGFGVLAGCLGIGLIIIVILWAFGCCYCRGQIQQDEEYYKLQLNKIENEMN